VPINIEKPNGRKFLKFARPERARFQRFRQLRPASQAIILRARALSTTRCGRNREQGCLRRRRRRCSATPPPRPPHVLPTRRIAHTRTPRSFARSVPSVAGAAPSGREWCARALWCYITLGETVFDIAVRFSRSPPVLS